MSEKTKIEWVDSTASPWNGCTPVSPGCDHCWAAARDKRHLDQPKAKRNGQAPVCHWGKGAPRAAVPSFEKTMLALNRKAMRLGKPLTVFPSTCDPFDDEVPIEMLANYLRVVFETPHLIHLMLTKRPELWKKLLNYCVLGPDPLSCWLSDWLDGSAPSNVWVGVSVEDQRRACERRDAFKQIPAVRKFVSYEPALEAVDWRGWEFINWIILGGESGPGARPCNIQWLRSGLAFFRPLRVKCFVKQMGSKPYVEHSSRDPVLCPIGAQGPMLRRLRDPKGGNPKEWPSDLRVREWPEAIDETNSTTPALQHSITPPLWAAS